MAVTCRGLNVDFLTREGSVRALEDFRIDVDDEEFVAVIGPSGCGKSTLLRAIGGLLAPSAGRVEITGVRPGQSATAMALQDPGLLPKRARLDAVPAFTKHRTTV